MHGVEESRAFQYQLDVYRGHSTEERLATVPIRADFSAVKECAAFDDARRTIGSSLAIDPDRVAIVPKWHTRLGAPYLSGVEGRIAGDARRYEVPVSYFHSLARTVVANLTRDGKLVEGEDFGYLVSAYPQDLAAEPATSDDGLRVDRLVPAVPVVARSLANYLSAARPQGPVDPHQFPVFVPLSIISEATRLTESAGRVETGGILLADFFRDTAGGGLFAQVTAQIPAHAAQGTPTQLTFTQETWSAVEAARNLRNRRESYLGWWHSHPQREWCRDCPLEQRLQCKLTGEFFSDQDVHLHRTVFPRAYSIALVVCDSYAKGLTFPMFGWHQGVVAERGFYILERPVDEGR